MSPTCLVKMESERGPPPRSPSWATGGSGRGKAGAMPSHSQMPHTADVFFWGALEGQSADTVRLWSLGLHSHRLSQVSALRVHPRKERRKRPASLVAAAVSGPLGRQPFPFPSLPVPVLPSGPAPRTWGAKLCLPACPPCSQRQVCLELSRAGPRGGPGLPTTPLKEADRPSAVRGRECSPREVPPLGLSREAVGGCERKVLCFGCLVQQGCACSMSPPKSNQIQSFWVQQASI